MSVFFLSIISFSLFFIYDINEVIWEHPLLQKFFFIGNILLTWVTAKVIYLSNVKITVSLSVVTGALLFFLFFFLLLYTLYGALPFEETYKNKTAKRKVYDKGVYALCRHPGVLWMAGMYGTLAFLLKSQDGWTLFFVTTVCNLTYVLFQDYWTFPKVFADYGDYKKTTPFLIPDNKSCKRCVTTIRRVREENEEFNRETEKEEI